MGAKDATSEGLQHPSSKFRERVSSDGVEPASSTAGSTTQRAPSLDTMPGEILLQILRHSREPSLIHACRSLHRKLPDYVGYVRSMAILAFMPRKLP